MSWDEFSDHKPPSAAQLRAQAAQRIQVLTDEGYQLTPIPTGSRERADRQKLLGQSMVQTPRSL